MPALNDVNRFGWITRTLHWGTVVAVFAAVPLGLYIADMELSLEAIRYFGWHKSVGITVLGLAVLRILWHRISPPPRPVAHAAPWQDSLAKGVHRSLYVLIVAMPLSGWVASSATGIPSVVFGTVTLPAIAPVSETWQEAGFAIHRLLGWLFMTLILVHAFGAIYRSLVLKDGTIARMLRG